MAKDKLLGSLALSKGNNVAQVPIYSNTFQKKQKISLLFADAINKGILNSQDLVQLDSELISFVFIFTTEISSGKSIDLIFHKSYNWDSDYNGQRIAKIIGDYIRTFVDARKNNSTSTQSAPPQIDLRKMKGRIIQFKNHVVKYIEYRNGDNIMEVIVIGANDGKYKSSEIYADEKMFDNDAKLLEINDGDVFEILVESSPPIVNFSNKSMVDVEWVSSVGGYRLTDTKTGTRIVQPTFNNEDIIKDNLFKISATYIGNSKTNLSTTSQPSATPTQHILPKSGITIDISNGELKFEVKSNNCDTNDFRQKVGEFLDYDLQYAEGGTAEINELFYSTTFKCELAYGDDSYTPQLITELDDKLYDLNVTKGRFWCFSEDDFFYSNGNGTILKIEKVNIGDKLPFGVKFYTEMPDGRKENTTVFYSEKELRKLIQTGSLVPLNLKKGDDFIVQRKSGDEEIAILDIDGIQITYQRHIGAAYGEDEIMDEKAFKNLLWEYAFRLKNFSIQLQDPEENDIKVNYYINDKGELFEVLGEITSNVLLNWYELDSENGTLDKMVQAYDYADFKSLFYPFIMEGGDMFHIYVNNAIRSFSDLDFDVIYRFKDGKHILKVDGNTTWKEFDTQEEVEKFLFENAARMAENQELIQDAMTKRASNPKKSTREMDKAPTSTQEEEIEQLNKDIAQLMFFKSILSPIDFEKKIELSQDIEKKQKRVNELNFYLLEKRIQSNNIFEELFEQSFNPINNAYEGVYSTSPDETDFFTPDGKKSELSDSLNVMIRTPQFKAWFGDWELAYLYKDTDAVEIDCSKVLTNNYEPLVVWHGTGDEFSYFKFENFPAAYFAVNREYSEFFAQLHGDDSGFVIPFFLNIRNPLDLTHFETKDVSVKDFFDYIFLQTGLDMSDLEVNPIFFDDTFQPVQTWIFIRNNPTMLQKIASLNIFDGIRFYETNPNVKDTSSPAHKTEAFITFKANQSKIADPERGTILLGAMKSFILEKGGAI